jgi:hypothetical protein
MDEAVALHNAVPQGLSSAIFSTDLLETERFLSHEGSDCGIANVLENKYNPEKGYKEYSLDWWMTDTRCDFCREEVVYARLVNTNYFSKVVGVAHDNINYKDCGIAIQDKGFVDGEFITKDFNEFVEFKSYRDLTDEEKRSVINNNGNN